ncbi:hypothetical protein [Kibdelosporangium aridum]|uniref:Uncharacterized protein n=1 Tax=Kibdelosporangium aridum TaxID=2030 RepID=A0A1W2G0L3_KIBAR|nr:hypothetical protein [Kibdelosporangium aridum]SMD27663.1 hypothetical protein SAMN05661093_11275 [Kibdelosporangium aridum]
MIAAVIVFGLVVAACVAWIIRAALHDHRRIDLEDTASPTPPVDPSVSSEVTRRWRPLVVPGVPEQAKTAKHFSYLRDSRFDRAASTQ